MTDAGVSTADRSRARVALIALAVAALAAVPFLTGLQNEFVSWDDDRNFVRNPFYRGLGLTQIKWMWTTFHMGHYVPLTWMTHGLDYVLWGMDPFGYHLTNIVLHSANAAVVFFVARRLLSLTLEKDRTDASVAMGAAFAAVLFAVHPLRVESVAWATERRDVLSGVLYSLTVLVYLRAIEAGTITPRRYAAIFGLFLASLLAKATSMTLPAVLLLLNVFPLRRLTLRPLSWPRLKPVANELVPLFLLSVAAMLLSVRALSPGGQLSLLKKIAVSSYGLAFYIWKTLVPVSLGPIYPMPLEIPVASPAYVASYALVACLALLVVLQWRHWPGVVTAIAVFVVISLPMLGAVQNGPQVAADRYTYHAAPALATLAGAGLTLALQRFRFVTLGAAAALLSTLGVLTWKQTQVWRNSTTLWTQAVKVADHSAIAHDGLATTLYHRDSIPQALAHYERAAQLNPFYADARANMGIALARLGRFNEAPQHFQRALELKPDFDMAENNWGVVEAMQGNLMAAIGHFRLALQINPNNGDAELNWANALVSGGNLDVALPHYQRAVELNPASVDAEARWGAALAQLGRLEEAIPHFQRAIALNPSDEKAQRLLTRAQSELAAKKAAGDRR
jgi:tetratricopeptide (TPR) repeat protein